MAAVTVSVMFTDLVGSTALLSEVGEVAADALRREHFGLVRETLEAAGGTVVKNLGDGFMVVFTSASEAVGAGVAVQRALERRNRTASHPLIVRMGLALGDADRDEDDYFGVPVVQAARLCAAASGGEILCTETVRVLAGTRTEASFEAVGELDLKGLDEPLAAWRVRWEAARETAPPLPARVAVAINPEFVGRTAEHQVLTSAWKSAVAEVHARVVLLAGEPGIGKTTLSARLASEVHDEGALVVYGRSDEDLGVPYQPWVEALAQLADAVPDELLDDHVAQHGDHLAVLVPRLARGSDVTIPATTDDGVERYVLFGCVVDLLERISSETSVLIVLDDLHWADRQSLQLLRHVVGVGRLLRVLIVGTFRDTDVSAADPMTELLAALHREPNADRISLRGLADTDLLDLLERRAGHEMDDSGVALRDAVLAETEGNPFFVGEILRHLAETGVIYRGEDGRWVGDVDIRTVGLPVSVKEVVGRRVAALGSDAERVLAHAAVIGRDFDVGLLARVVGLDEDTVIDLCDAGVAASVLQSTDHPDRYSFAHALVERTLYDGLSPARRARIHRTVAESIEATSGEQTIVRAGELAHHFAAAVQPTDTAKAARYAQLAGDRALGQLAPDEAVRWYGQALDLLGRSPDATGRRRAELLVGLGTAQRQSGLAEHRDTLLDAARLADELDETDLLVRAVLANRRPNFGPDAGLVDADRVTMIERALARGPADGCDRAQLLCAAAAERSYGADFDELHAIATEAVAIARRCCAPPVLVQVLHEAALIRRAPETIELRRALDEEALDLAAGMSDPAAVYPLHGEMTVLALELGDGAGVRHHAALRKELGARICEPSMRWDDVFGGVVIAILAGDLAEAERLAEESVQTGLELGQPDAMAIYGAQLVNIRFHDGRLAELVELVESAIAERPGLSAFRAVLAHACLEAGDRARAVALLEAARAEHFACPRNNLLTTTLASWAYVAVELRDHDGAAMLREALAPHHALIVTTTVTVLPAVAHFLGRLDHLLGRFEEADAWFAEAEEIHRRAGSPLFAAHNDAAWAALLADCGGDADTARARTLAERALTVAEAGGYGGVAAEARAVLAGLDR